MDLAELVDDLLVLTENYSLADDEQMISDRSYFEMGARRQHSTRSHHGTTDPESPSPRLHHDGRQTSAATTGLFQSQTRSEAVFT